MNKKTAARDGYPALKLASAITLALSATTVYAGLPPPLCDPSLENCSVVNTAVEAASPGMQKYMYTVTNTSTVEDTFIVDWEIPYYEGQGISAIDEDSYWDNEIEEIGYANAAHGWGGVASWQQEGDSFNNLLTDIVDNGPQAGIDMTAAEAAAFLGATHVLHWFLEFNSDTYDDNYDDSACDGTQMITVADNYNSPVDGCFWEYEDDSGRDWINPFGGSLDGFEFIAPLGSAVDAPYQASWAFNPPMSGDPPIPCITGCGPSGFILPDSVIATQNPPGVPEPSTLLLTGLGIAGLSWSSRRRTRKSKQGDSS